MGMSEAVMTKDALIEALAAIEHERWSDWQHYVQDERCRPELNMAGRVSLVINADDAERWERQFQTPYADLSEREKQSDRDQVSRYWPLIVDFVERWLTNDVNYHGLEPSEIVRNWREEMGE
jgi:hypothetical protein